MRASSILLLFLSHGASADPPPATSVGVGLEGGAWLEIGWLGGAVEVEVPMTSNVAVRATARWQRFSDVYDECDLDFVGRQLDATAGVGWRPRDWQHVHPFLALQAGAGLERLHTTCAGAAAFDRGSWVVETGGGIDIDSDPTSRFSLRLEARLSLARFVPNGGELDQVFNQEVGVAVLVVARL